MSVAAWGQPKDKQCGSKRTYHNKAEAKLALKRAATLHGGFHTGSYEIYRCPWCGSFHVGSKLGAKSSHR